MKRVLEAFLSVAKLWLDNTQARIAKLLAASGIALIAAPWWQPILQKLVARHLELDLSTVNHLESTATISGWLLIFLGVVLLLLHKRSYRKAPSIDLSAHWWRRCINDGFTEHQDLFMTVINKSEIELPSLNVHIFPSNTYQLEPIEKPDRLMPGQHAMYRFPVVDEEGSITDSARNFYSVAQDKLSIRVFKSHSGDDPLLISFPLGRELHDHIGNCLQRTA